MRTPLLLSTILACAAPVFAADADPQGYVVKVESGSIYLDLGEKAGAAVGQPFSVYTEGEELKHPVTGASLGKVTNTVAEGAVNLVMPMYSVGTLRAGSGEVKSGMRAKLGEAPKPAPAPSAPGAVAKDGVAFRAPRWKSPAFGFAVTGMAIADFRGEGKPTTALADKKTVSLYAYPPAQDQPLAQFVQPGVGPRIINLSAGDLNGNGRPELFVSLYNETFTRAETVVLEWTDGQWKKLTEFPWLVRQYQDPEGKPVLAMQQLVEDQTFPFSNIYRVTYNDGKYGPGKDAIRFKRVEFLYDFTQANLDGSKDPALLYQTSTNHVRVQFPGGFWKTPDAYLQTPTRLRWHGRLLEFHPQIPVAYDGAKATVYLIKNESALGSLSEPFGLFNGGIVEKQAWDGVALKPEWRTDLGGYSTSAVLVPGPQKPSDLAVAVTGTSGKSSVWILDP